VRVLGIDEAGYGPLLGPLVVGGVSLECERYDPEVIWRAIGPDSGIADSKTVLSHRGMAPGEETTLALLEALGIAGADVGQLLNRLLVPCPAPTPGSGAEGGPPWVGGSCGVVRARRPRPCVALDRAVPRWGRPPGAGRAAELRRRLGSVGVELVGARAVVACPGAINRAVAGGASKLLLDWRLFAELLRRDQDDLAPHGLAVCGKLGGRAKYGELLADIGLTTAIMESRARSAYAVAGLGHVEFVRHAEAAHAPVAMASMIAKLVREYVLDAWHAELSGVVDGLETCSGYRDPITAKYVEVTRRAREELGIADACFLRDK